MKEINAFNVSLLNKLIKNDSKYNYILVTKDFTKILSITRFNGAPNQHIRMIFEKNYVTLKTAAMPPQE